MSQKRMGPAPFASFEDLSDEVRHGVESPTAVVRLPEIRECPQVETPQSRPMNQVTTLQTPSTPRIDISRASSSSHHEEDSRDSTPERELFEPQCARLGLAFKEDGAMDLRSSTEELDFQEAGTDPPPAETRSSQSHIRKDSQGSELGFLSVSGRTSRLSSIGSQGSRASNQSHLSATSRSPSPHKMLLETSFCGTKGSETGVAQPPGGAALEPALEQALLSRKHDPTQAVLAEGISIEMRKKIQPVNSGSPKRRPIAIPIVIESENAVTEVLQHPISPGKTIVADSGVEYTFIPLKGPLPTNLPNKPNSAPKNRPVPPARRLPASGTANSKPTTVKSEKTAPLSTKNTDSPEYIRIKLKPDHMYPEGESCINTHVSEVHKPVTLNLNNGTSGRVAAPHVPPTVAPVSGGSPKLPRLRDTVSRTPSPSVSRKSSFTSLFRSKEAIISSPESPGDRARSKSKEREHKSSVFGIFKPKRSCIKKQSSPEQTVPVTSPLPSLEFTFNSKPQERLKYYETPLEGDSIRIPLHSPGTEPEPLKLSSPATPPETAPKENQPPPVNPRHSSTSSETIIFTTNLGSNNEIFTTKLPKEKHRITENHCEKPVSLGEKTPIENEHTQESDYTSPSENKEPKIKLGEKEITHMTRSESSESEREIPECVARKAAPDDRDNELEDEHELKTLVMAQQDSFEDDELPYVPTTLPLERSVAIPIVPIKQRGEIKMCPIERPRSTTPINPNCLDEYCEDGVVTAEPKLRISLPKEDLERTRGKSPRKWADFAEQDMGGSSSPPPLPPRGAPKDWINFEEVPERRKPPKRIQIIPSSAGRAGSSDDNVIYSYVNPEDCKCECHELAPRAQPDGDKPQSTDAFPNHQKLSS